MDHMCALTPGDLQRIFEKLDMDGDGFVSLDNLNWMLQKTGFQFEAEELESLNYGKKTLDLNEFLFLYQSISGKGGEEEDDDLVKAFMVFDMDGDGFISSQEVECVLRRLGLWDEKSGKDCRSMICVYDTNLDGQLDFQEFKNMMLLTIPQI